MALRTLGSNAPTSLSAVLYSQDPALMSYSDQAAINALIKADQIYSDLRNNQLVRDGHLYIPGRGTLNLLPGDFIAVDAATGWPILLSGKAAAAGPYTHT